MEFKRPRGDITTLLDLTDRDVQENDFFPLDTATTWFTRNPDRRTIPFVPVVQDFSFRGPASYGQRFSFEIGSLPCGDVLLGTAVQVKLSHWLDLTTQVLISSGQYTYDTPSDAFFFANSIGSALIEKAELEIEGVTVEQIDGDFIYIYGNLSADLNMQFGLSRDSIGYVTPGDLLTWNPKRNFPVEDGTIFCTLPFFYMRNRLRESLPMVALKDGSARIHITFRPFDQVVRQKRGYRDTCDSVPLGTTVSFNSNSVIKNITEVVPNFQEVKLITYGAYLDGQERNKMLREPFEHIMREVQTFYFEEPLKYAISKTANDTITIQLPLEANHPLEEIIWFVRRKQAANNNEWTNYSSVVEREYDATFNPPMPMLKRAVIQANGVTLCDASEQYYRQLISSYHKGGFTPYRRFIYGYPFARHPSEEHQPSGSLNASRVQSLRLTLEVQPPETSLDAGWEVKVFCIGLNWIRFENGIANKLFSD